jgi:hypothetical protein
VLNLAARHRDGKWLLLYLDSGSSSSAIRSKSSGGEEANAFWIGPSAGRSISIGNFPGRGVGEFTTREGWQVALLILESPDGLRKSPAEKPPVGKEAFGMVFRHSTGKPKTGRAGGSPTLRRAAGSDAPTGPAGRSRTVVAKQNPDSVLPT